MHFDNRLLEPRQNNFTKIKYFQVIFPDLIVAKQCMHVEIDHFYVDLHRSGFLVLLESANMSFIPWLQGNNEVHYFAICSHT